MHRGYIKIWRKLEDSGLLQMHGTFCLFMHMLLKATHKDRRVGMVDLKRGQFISGRHQLASAINLTEQQLRTSEKKLVDLLMIERKSTNQFTVYTIVNYENYQDASEQDNKPITNDQQTDNKRITTIQEHNNLNIKEKPISSPKGTRLPQDAILSSSWGNTALELRTDWSNDDVRNEYESFKDFWTAKAGKDGVKLDWLATWRNWCRNSRRKGILNAGS